MYGREFDNMLVRFVLCAVAVGVALGLFFAFGIPWLWGLVKPMLHAWTA